MREYERERVEYRAAVMDTERKRRLSFGTIITMMFENRDTMRLQIQEMTRVEKLVTDDDIHVELDTHNPMIPEHGQLTATVFLELTSDDQMREWLPKLVGIEIEHPDYLEAIELSDSTNAELFGDLRG